MWRDPLDELIEDLERCGQPPEVVADDDCPIEKFQQLLDAVLYGSPSDLEALLADPACRRWEGRASRGR